MSTRTREEISHILKNNIVSVEFTKSDGTHRVMKCTLVSTIIPAMSISEESTSTKKVRAFNPDVLPVWDLDNSGWRSFRIDSVVDIIIEEKDAQYA